MRLLAALLIVVALAGCSSSGGSGGSTAGGLPAHPTSGPKADRVFLSVERGQFPSSIDDKTLIGLAHNLCHDFDHKVDWVTEVAALIHTGGMPAKTAGGFIAASVATYCPKHVAVLPTH